MSLPGSASAAITTASSPSSSRPPPRPSSSILHLYAELLLHIRTITLTASLRTAHTPETRAELSADGDRVTLTHEGEQASIRLPTRIVGGGEAALTLPRAPSKDLALRLQLREKPGSGGGLFVEGGRAGPGGKENVVPWGAGALDGCKRVACRACGEEIVRAADEGPEGEGDDAERPGVKRWMDLPSENWAEMMDFWHCHKPHEHHLPGHRHDGVGGEKGYAAGNRIVAKRGVGYVDLAYLLLAEADCKGVQPSTSTTSDQRPTLQQQLRCSSCKTVVGVVDPRAEGWRIWKWSIAVTRKGSPSSQTYSIRKWTSAQLLFLIENQGVRKFTVVTDHTTEDSESEEKIDPIMIWVFTPDLSFSSSIAADHRNDPTRAMKVLWKVAPVPPPALEEAAAAGGPVQQPARYGKTESQALDRGSLSVEELSLPATAFRALIEALREGGEWLPENAREFKEWKVGLVERFSEDEV